MAKVSYRRLAEAMVAMLEKHTTKDVVAAATQVMAAGGAKPDIDRLTAELERELAKQKGHVVIHATTARELPAATLEHLATEFTERLGAKTYELETAIDASLLGGVKLATADAVLDLSLRTRLETIRI